LPDAPLLDFPLFVGFDDAIWCIQKNLLP